VAWDGIMMAMGVASNERMATLRPQFEAVTKLEINKASPAVLYRISLGPTDLAQLAQVAIVMRDALSEILKVSMISLLLQRFGLAAFRGSLDLLARTLESAAPKCYLRESPSVSDESKPSIYS